ncbi:MAG: hypothetical protein ACU0DI_05815, partial [Paracoccaceae bacterium]
PEPLEKSWHTDASNLQSCNALVVNTQNRQNGWQIPIVGNGAKAMGRQHGFFVVDNWTRKRRNPQTWAHVKPKVLRYPSPKTFTQPPKHSRIPLFYRQVRANWTVAKEIAVAGAGWRQWG